MSNHPMLFPFVVLYQSPETPQAFSVMAIEADHVQRATQIAAQLLMEQGLSRAVVVAVLDEAAITVMHQGMDGLRSGLLEQQQTALPFLVLYQEPHHSTLSMAFGPGLHAQDALGMVSGGLVAAGKAEAMVLGCLGYEDVLHLVQALQDLQQLRDEQALF